MTLKFCLSVFSILEKVIFIFSEEKVSPTFKLVITSEEKILLNKILKISKLKPK